MEINTYDEEREKQRDLYKKNISKMLTSNKGKIAGIFSESVSKYTRNRSSVYSLSLAAGDEIVPLSPTLVPGLAEVSTLKHSFICFIYLL